MLLVRRLSAHTKSLYVGKILLAASRPLVGNVLLSAKIINRHVSEYPWLLGHFCLLPRNTGDRCDQIDSNRRHPKLDDFVWVLEVLYGQVGKLEAEGCQRLKNTPGILGIRTYEDVDVTCEAGGTVEGQGISSDNQVFNLVLVQ